MQARRDETLLVAFAKGIIEINCGSICEPAKRGEWEWDSSSFGAMRTSARKARMGRGEAGESAHPIVVFQKSHRATAVASSVGYVRMNRGYMDVSLSLGDEAQYDICKVSMASVPRRVAACCATSLRAGPTTTSGAAGVNSRVVSAPIVTVEMEPLSITDTESCTSQACMASLAN